MAKLRRAAGVLVFALSSAIATNARAQSSMEEPRTIDTVRGTIRGSTRFIGLAGAFVAIADDTEGVANNPASAAVRLPYSWDAFSFSVGIDFAVATWLPKNDVFNTPEGTKGGSLFGSFAASRTTGTRASASRQKRKKMSPATSRRDSAPS